MSFLPKLIGVSIPTPEEVIQQYVLKQDAPELQQIPVSHNPPVNEPQSSQPNLAKIEIVLMRNNDCRLAVILDESAKGEEDASAIARMLCQLNEGAMKATFANIILTQSTQDVSDTQFGHMIMKQWEKLYKEQDEVMVKPSHALQAGQ